ncbi:MAG: alanyl-tRNA editing protein [Atopobiaceae bacterium]
MEKFDELYYREPYTKEFDATVTSCEPRDGGYAIELSEAAFYPTGGGQPGDRGTLTYGEGEDAVVVHVTEAVPGKGADGSEEGAVELCDAALPVGVQVHGALDWTWRRDNMEAHTGEHIVSGIVHALFGFDNIGFHMGEKCIEVDFDGVLSAEDALEVERRANAAVREDVPVEVLLPTPDELAAMEYRSKKDHEGQIRVVKIGDVDTCACCGTHLSTSGQVGLIKIVRMSTKKKKTRLELLCGRRALELCEERLDQLRDTSNFLSVADEEVPEAVRRLSAEKDDYKHQLKQVQREKLAQAMAAAAPEGSLLLWYQDGLEIDELRYVCEQALGRDDIEKVAALSAVAGDPSRIAYVLAAKEEDLRPVCKELNKRLSGRGGGKPQMVQGSWASVRDDAEAAVRELLG